MEKAKVYRGIEFVRISELPENQKVEIQKWASDGQIIKILKDEQLMSDCVQYKDYTYWFEVVFKVATANEPVQNSPRQVVKPIKLAIGR